MLFVAVNVAGVYVHDRTEHARRKAFSDTRACVAARLDMEDENQKLVSSSSLRVRQKIKGSLFAS